MSDFTKEFPDFPPAEMPKMPRSFVDTSWHNDACPSFTSDALGLTVFIDYEEHAKREHGDKYPRFNIQPQEAGEEITGDGGLLANNWYEVTDYIQQHAAKRFAPVLDELITNDGACLYWQMSTSKLAQQAVETGFLEMDGDLVVHPDATQIEEGMAYTLDNFAEGDTVERKRLKAQMVEHGIQIIKDTSEPRETCWHVLHNDHRVRIASDELDAYDFAANLIKGI